MTGDTANGKSTSVKSPALPLNLKRVIAHAAATPKRVLSGTQMPAVNSVSLIAARASGSRMEAR
jgi:hypothetical protein